MITPIVLAALSAAHAGKKIGMQEIAGKYRMLYCNGDFDNLEKYYLDEKGNRVSAREAMQSEVAGQMAFFGSFSTRLHAKLEKMEDGKAVKVKITFAVPSADQTLSRGEAESRAGNALNKGKAHLKKDLGLEAAGPVDWDGRTISATLTKGALQRLRHDPDIASIELDEVDPSVVPKPATTFSEIFVPYIPYSLAATAFGNSGYSGQSAHVGVIEAQGLVSSDVPTWFNFGYFRPRPGTPVNPATFHATAVLSVIKNRYGTPNPDLYGWGGAFNLGTLSFATAISGEANLFNAYGWASSTAYGDLTNSSWAFMRWTGTDAAQAQNSHDRYWDIHASDYPYMLNVVAAGNEGSSQPVSWWGHNNVVVGSINSSGAMASTSAYLNGSTGDEVPHVVAIGENVQFPDGSVHSGTSISAPAVSALVADFYDKYPGYKTAPQVTKAALLASAIEHPVDGESYSNWKDTRGGFGIPDGYALNSIGANGYTLYNGTSPGGVGCFMTGFTSSEGNGALDVVTVTSTAPANSYVNFVTTWFSDPEGTCASGNVCKADDVDLWVYDQAGNTLGYSITIKNSTERVQILKTQSEPVTYTVKIKLYTRITNKAIPVGTAWTYTMNPSPLP